jgi:hypothetical protein
MSSTRGTIIGKLQVDGQSNFKKIDLFSFAALEPSYLSVPHYCLKCK